LISILLDTSFLITLADPARPNHPTALRYLREALGQGAPLYLSAIVASEFQVKQAVTDLPLRNLQVLPFNIDHAMTAGNLMRVLQRDPGDDRAAVKDDVKLMAQMQCESISHVLTEDKNTLAKYLARLNELGQSSAKAILLTQGFDATWFNGGQHSLIDH
jgi:predicted nucleic acid-binding protein